MQKHDIAENILLCLHTVALGFHLARASIDAVIRNSDTRGAKRTLMVLLKAALETLFVWNPERTEKPLFLPGMDLQ
jgi:hypothetical protein